jgi:MATE family multidrug resistance protein
VTLLEKRETKELEWLDRPLAELLRLAWPIAVSTLSYSAMTVVDTLFVSGIGTAALAGVGMAGIAAFTLVCFSIGLLRGVKVLVSQAVGAQRHHEVGALLSAGLAMAVAMGGLVVAAGQLVAPLLTHLAASAEAGVHADTYLRIRILGAPLLLVYVTIRETRYGQGDARSPMVASVSCNVVNIALDYVLIYMLGWGVAGAAWATVAANAVEAAILVYWHRRLIGRVRGGLGFVRRVWRMGVPTGVQFLMEVGSFAVLTVMLAAVSEVDLAAHQIVLHVQHFSFLPAYALAEAASVMAGQSVGANRDDLVNGIAKRAMVLAAAYTALCTVVFGVGAHAIAGAFTDDPELLSTTVTLIYVSLGFLVADSANIVARAILRGTGDVTFAAIVGITCAWMMTPPVTWLLGMHLGWGAPGAWIGLTGVIFAGAVVWWWRLASGGWRKAAGRSRADAPQREEPIAAAA